MENEVGDGAVLLEDAPYLEDDDSDEYEDYDIADDEEEDDRRNFGIYQCLPVDDEEPDWASGEPQTVEEYLRRVRHEARQLPDVVTCTQGIPRQEDELQEQQQHAADAPHGQQQQQGDDGGSGGASGRRRGSRSSRYLVADTSVPSCDAALQPSAAWHRDFLRQFARLHQRLQREYEVSSGQAAAPGGEQQASLLRYQRQEVAAAAAEELEALALDPPSALMPELLQLKGLDQLQVRRQLHSTLRDVVRQGRVDAASAAALYAASARIEKPVHAGTAALYRELLRLAAGLRAAAAGPSDPALPHLNIVIAIAGAYFGQDEHLAALCDEE